MNEKTSDVSLKNVGKGLRIPIFICTFALLKTKIMKTFKTINEKDWAEVFGVEPAAEEESKKNIEVSIEIPWMFFNPEVVDIDSLEEVSVMDCSAIDQ